MHTKVNKCKGKNNLQIITGICHPLVVSLRQLLQQKTLETVFYRQPLWGSSRPKPWSHGTSPAFEQVLLLRSPHCVYVSACEDAKEGITPTWVEEDKQWLHFLTAHTMHPKGQTYNWHGWVTVFISPVPLSAWRDDWPCHKSAKRINIWQLWLTHFNKTHTGEYRTPSRHYSREPICSPPSTLHYATLFEEAEVSLCSVLEYGHFFPNLFNSVPTLKPSCVQGPTEMLLIRAYC